MSMVGREFTCGVEGYAVHLDGVLDRIEGR